MADEAESAAQAARRFAQENERLQAENARLRKALRFYAQGDRWFWRRTMGPNGETLHRGEPSILDDMGSVALAALNATTPAPAAARESER